jgi:putative ABC transport system substrate-binding protein
VESPTQVTRRKFVILLGGAAAAWPFAARARQLTASAPRVGYLFSFTPAEGRHLWEACQQGLRELGYVDGQNVVLEPRWADGHHERLGQLAAELARLRVDVIVSAATPASRAAKAATSSIPIVIVAVGEPVKTGLVTSLARPGGNVTGLSLLTTEMSGKRLELLSAIAGSVRSMAVLMNPDNAVHAVFWDETRAAAQTSGIQLQLLKARNPSEIEDAFNAVTQDRAPALIVFDDPVIWSHRVQVVTLAAKRRLPVMYGLREFVDDGGLMSYGPDRVDHYRRTAIYVDKILKGAKTVDLAVEQPTKFEFVINLKTAKALGLAVPPLLLAQANEVLE